MSGIMDAFRSVFSGTPAQSTTAPNNQGTPGNLPPGTPPSNTTPATPPNGEIPPNTNTNLEVKEPTPFADFKDLWKTDPTDPNKPAPDASVFGTIDPKKFMEAAGKIDFSKAVSQEQLQAIQAGGEGATKVLLEVMNKVAQGTYAQSAFATTKIVEQAIAKSKETFLAELPQHIKKQTVTDSLRAENPIFSNPAVAPIISALEAQMTVKFPNATAPEITAMARQYVEQLGTAFVPKAKVDPNAKVNKGEIDWEKEFFPT